MTPVDTVSDLFAVAIAAEGAAKCFYKGLADAFSHVPPASRFWETMMTDEAMHERELQEIKSTLTDEQLNSPADQSLLVKIRNELERFSGKFDVTSIETLDDAYEIAYELEYSEVNTVFNAILSEFVTSDSRTKFVLELIDKHVSRLEDFSSIHDRKNIRARHQLYSKE